MMGQSDGFTLVKGMSSFGLTKARKRANIDQSKFSRFSEMTRTHATHFDPNDTVRTKQLGGTERRNKNKHRTIDQRELTNSDQFDGNQAPYANSVYTSETMPVIDQRGIGQ